MCACIPIPSSHRGDDTGIEMEHKAEDTRLGFHIGLCQMTHDGNGTNISGCLIWVSVVVLSYLVAQVCFRIMLLTYHLPRVIGAFPFAPSVEACLLYL